MRVEYGLELTEVKVPRFSVEAVEGIGKLFTLATTVLNILDTSEGVEIVFHGLNPDDPEARIEAFREITAGASGAPELTFTIGRGGRISNSSSYYRWVTITR